jgi:hypothetical protein
MKCITLGVLRWAGAWRRDFKSFLDTVIVVSGTLALSGYVIVCFDDIGEIVDNHYLYFFHDARIH